MVHWQREMRKRLSQEFELLMVLDIDIPINMSSELNGKPILIQVFSLALLPPRGLYALIASRATAVLCLASKSLAWEWDWNSYWNKKGAGKISLCSTLILTWPPRLEVFALLRAPKWQVLQSPELRMGSACRGWFRHISEAKFAWNKKQFTSRVIKWSRQLVAKWPSWELSNSLVS